MPTKRASKAKKQQNSGSAVAAVKAAESVQSAIEDALNARAVTGSLASMPTSRDVKIDAFTLSLHGIVLIEDTVLEFNFGRRYGFIGLNGCGKSTMLTCIGKREVPIPEFLDIYHLEGEIDASDLSAIEAVVENVEIERKRLEKEAEELTLAGNESEQLMLVYERLDELEADLARKSAGEILHGLGFTKEMQNKKTKDFSGGWRMRIALAKALFMKPMILLLDEPTNHLDLEACVWLEEYLKNYNRILVLISHSQDFLNGVCTNIIHLQNKKLTYYSGNYDTYIKSRQEREDNQMKAYDREQDQIAHMKDYIARFGHGSAKLARQAKSKEKTLARMESDGLTQKVTKDKILVLRFNDPGTLSPPVVQFQQVTFSYNNDSHNIYKNLDFGVDLDSRIALVGPNGAGKSTFLKLLVGTLNPTRGMVRRHQHLRIGWYHQHLTEQLDLDLNPLEYMLKCFPGEVEREKMRQEIGRFGISGKLQTTPIGQLSDGQKSRVAFAWMAWQSPHLLLLDEPTNHLDIETIDSLADALNEFEGGVVLVSHDFRLISQMAREIWVCDKGTVRKWEGDIQGYKKMLREQMLNE